MGQFGRPGKRLKSICRAGALGYRQARNTRLPIATTNGKKDPFYVIGKDKRQKRIGFGSKPLKISRFLKAQALEISGAAHKSKLPILKTNGESRSVIGSVMAQLALT